jgi:hypothetical protein
VRDKWLIVAGVLLAAWILLGDKLRALAPLGPAVKTRPPPPAGVASTKDQLVKEGVALLGRAGGRLFGDGTGTGIAKDAEPVLLNEYTGPDVPFDDSPGGGGFQIMPVGGPVPFGEALV